MKALKLTIRYSLIAVLLATELTILAARTLSLALPQRSTVARYRRALTRRQQ
jgi:hypothetical protein